MLLLGVGKGCLTVVFRPGRNDKVRSIVTFEVSIEGVEADGGATGESTWRLGGGVGKTRAGEGREVLRASRLPMRANDHFGL
jgi:hypothetical protein